MSVNHALQAPGSMHLRSTRTGRLNLAWRQRLLQRPAQSWGLLCRSQRQTSAGTGSSRDDVQEQTTTSSGNSVEAPQQLHDRLQSNGLASSSDPSSDTSIEPLSPTSTNATSSSTAGQPIDYKVIVGLCALVSLICSIDRASISVAIVPMAREFGWSDAAKGAISSSFFVGYTGSAALGGYVATKYSSKKVLAAGVVVWSLFTVATPTAAALGLHLVPLMGCRALMGAGEGVAFPAINSLFADWVPPSTRSRSLGLAYSAGQVGNITALVISPLIINQFGWPAAFWIFGSLGLTWLFAWVPLVPNQAAETASARAAAKRGVEDVGVHALSDVPWRMISRNKPAWATLLVHCSFGVGPLVLLSWLPSYYSDEWHLSVSQSSFLSGLPWACTFALALVSGACADALINRGLLDRTRTRKVMQGVASLGPAACLAILSQRIAGPEALTLPFAATLLTGTLAFGGFQAAGYGSNHQDLSPKYSGILFGLTNASASIAGAIAVWLTGILLDATDSWTIVFQVIAMVYVIGYAFYFAWASGEEQEFDSA